MKITKNILFNYFIDIGFEFISDVENRTNLILERGNINGVHFILEEVIDHFDGAFDRAKKYTSIHVELTNSYYHIQYQPSKFGFNVFYVSNEYEFPYYRKIKEDIILHIRNHKLNNILN